MKKVFNFLLITIISIVLFFGLFLLFITLTDYKPLPVEKISEEKGDVINIYDTLTIFSWNIGYCGLDKDMSFFYDGGEKMRTTKQQTINNLNNIRYHIKMNDSVDFYILQEVDINSHRSYGINEYDSILIILKEFKGYFATNYKVPFIPMPVTNPMGKVNGGLASFSNRKAFKVTRHAFEGNYSWPTGLFFLDRCFMVQRFYTSNGKELLIINTHNSAFDDGSLRLRQMQMIKEFLQKEYNKGNYIIVGGDWNQEPPQKGIKENIYKEKHLTRIRIAYDFMSGGWQWCAIEDAPTNRLIDKAYNPDSTITTTIDFFLLSPNLKCISQNNIDLKFENSDHNPTALTFTFED
jgi:exonuclease III